MTYITSYVFLPCAQVCGKLFESQDKLCDLQAMFLCVASCLSHRTSCVTYITSYVFVPCAQVCGKLFESQDKLCDLQVTC